MHICGVCLTDSAEHNLQCYEEGCGQSGVHWPPLCCPGCLCGSFEETHPEFWSTSAGQALKRLTGADEGHEGQ